MSDCVATCEKVGSRPGLIMGRRPRRCVQSSTAVYEPGPTRPFDAVVTKLRASTVMARDLPEFTNAAVPARRVSDAVSNVVPTS